jgi:hypothetical protein
MAVLEVFRQGSSDVAQTVNFTFSGTATITTDYTVTFPPGVTGTLSGSNATVTIPAAALSVNVNINVVPDAILEPDETIVVSVTGGTPAGAVLAPFVTAIFVIKNDDFQPVIKMLAVGPASTALVGTATTPTGNPYVAANSGPAPSNWTSWLIGGATGASVLTPSPAVALPYLLKTVLRAPSAQAAIGTDFAVLEATTATDFNIKWRARAVGYELVYQIAGQAAQSAGTYQLNSWVDIIVTTSSLNTLVYADSTLAVSGNPLPAIASLKVFAYSSAIAALAINNSQAYSSTLFPITSTNL